MASILWLADVLRSAGVRVVEEGDWRNRGVGGAFQPIGVLWHHTAATSSASNPAPALGLVINGRSDLRGPLAQALVDYNGVFHIVSANRANHAGYCRGSGPIPPGDGNTMLVGWEIDYNGQTQQMSAAQYSASVTATAAVLRTLGRDANHARGHRETSAEGKPDPAFINLDAMRADVGHALAGGTPRFGVVGGSGVLLVKDGRDSNWIGVNAGGATKVVLDNNWIGWIQDRNFHAKFGIHDTWRTMADGGQVTDIAISGDRFAFVNNAGIVNVKDGPDTNWTPINAHGATKVTLNGNWIGWIQDGNFHAKFGIHDTWRTMADGGQVTDIAISNNDWFGFIANGTYRTKQGPDTNWLTLADGGQITIAQRT